MIDRIQNGNYDVKAGNKEADNSSPISPSYIQLFNPLNIMLAQNELTTPSFFNFSSDKSAKSEKETVNVGDFKQGYINDCWLMATIKSLSLSTSGKQQLNKMIKVNDDNTYTVTFANGKEFNISEDELKEDKVKLANGKYAHNVSMIYINNFYPYVVFKIYPNITYSKGDKYAKLIEIAANRYVHELSEKEINEERLQPGKYTLDNYPLNETDIFGDVSHYVTKDVDISKLSEQDILYIATHSDSWINSLKNRGISHHAYSVKFIDKENKKIHLINPHNTKAEPLVINFDDFYERYAMIALKGNYKETAPKTNIENNINNSDFEKDLINIAGRQNNSCTEAGYAMAYIQYFRSIEDKDRLTKHIANMIDMASAGLGTKDNILKNLIFAIASKEELNMVNDYLSKKENSTYKKTAEETNLVKKYIEEEFSFSDKKMLLNYIDNLK